jgi:23S rRNA pseudouridine1911/1915/1917 synthase
MSESKFRIVFEDTHLIVVDKPAGLLSQGEETGDDNLVDQLRAYVGRNYIGLVHRLDRNTSGLLVVGKRTKSARRLTECLQDGTLKRAYQALLCGKLEGSKQWKHFLLKDESRNVVRVVPPHTTGAKSAGLLVQALSQHSFEGIPLTLARFELETGRSHQIRVQAAAEGHPLLGDRKYGESKSHFPRPALHSAWLSFPHPMTNEILFFEAPLPPDMAQVLR